MAPNTVTLIDGRQVDSASEAWRHECEARHVAKLPPHTQRGYIEAVTSRRGDVAGQALDEMVARVMSST